MNEPPVNPAFLKEIAIESFRRVWDTSVCLPIGESTCPFPETGPEEWYGAVAWIGGSWTGNVRVIVCPKLAEKLTRAFLSQTIDPLPTTLTPEEIQDSIRELANMVAGNLKASLPGKCGLATPGNFFVRSRSEINDEFHSILRQDFSVADGTLVVTVGAL